MIDCVARCDDGWIWVGDTYADKQVSEIEVPDDHPDREQLLGERDRKRRAALASVYPCRVCEPVSFLRWVRGHYKANHDCEACGDLRRSRKARDELRELAEATVSTADETRKDYI